MQSVIIKVFTRRSSYYYHITHATLISTKEYYPSTRLYTSNCVGYFLNRKFEVYFSISLHSNDFGTIILP